MALTKVSGDILKQPLNVGIITATSINVSGISTLGITSATNLTSQSLVVSGISTLGITSATNLTSQSLVVSGISTLGITSATNLTSQSLVVSGISTLGITSATNLTSQSLVVSGISTFTNGPILVGTATSTGTASQPLQVTGGAYVSGNLGVGITNPEDKIDLGSGYLRFKEAIGGTGTYGAIRAFNTLVNSVPATAIRFIRDVAEIGNDGAICFDTVNTERLRVDSSGNIKLTSNTYQALAHKNYGYSGSYGAVVIGATGNNYTTVSLGVDVSTIAGGNFTGQSQVIFPSNGALVPNNAGTNFIGVFSRNSSDSILIGPAGSAGISDGPLTVTGTTVGIGTTNPQYTLHVVGSFAATTKSFVIPHPTKPNYKLQHGSLEGPENGVYIRGRTTENIIELPEYWTELVDKNSITVNLTPIGDNRVWIEEINNNKVYIDSNSDIDCFYTVFAERKDVEKLIVEIEEN